MLRGRGGGRDREDNVQKCKSAYGLCKGAKVRGGCLGRVERPAQPWLTGPVSPTSRQRLKLKGKPETG